MEESELLKERLQAITEKHRIQEDIRQKKQELDREKLKLQHLKKKALRERWLLQDSVTHNATLQHSLQSDQQQTRALQLSIHRIEKDVESLEREESVVSTNESFILDRLKVVEKRPEEIIKVAQDGFVPEPLKVATLMPNVPQCLSLHANKHPQPPSRKTLFALEISVSRNPLTGEQTVVSAAPLPPQHQHTGVKVYDDGRKCVYALKSQEGSHDQGRASELSSNEVEQLLRSATEHCRVKQQTHSRREVQDERNHGERRSGHPLRLSAAEERHRRHADSQRKHQEEEQTYYNHQRNHQSHHVRNHKREEHGNDHANGTISMKGMRANGCPPPRSYDQEVVSACQPELCYTPANDIPLSDYISVEEEECYSYACRNRESNDSQSNPLFSGSAQAGRMPSPIYSDDTPYTILNTMETTEPITAIFMGFQTTQDESGRGQEYEGCLRAELVIIDDNDVNSDDNRLNEKNGHTQLSCNHGYPAGNLANGKAGRGEAGRTESCEFPDED
ncbi:hypothetical protein LDENG_00194250 [Lucifuga dentata]|nr:hypothetical protein LDENG_00194250 [Lucifuga dentata]